MADFFFFTDVDALSSNQTQEQAFGPVVGSEQTQYRITSGFTTNTDAKAYAMCSGQVFLQPHTESSKVNIILRPLRQPIKGLPIKYVIYRGLKKTDFIPSGNTELTSFADSDSGSEFIKLIWKQLRGLDDTITTFPAKWIGYDPANQTNDTLIDDYFFKADAYGDDSNETLKPFEFPMIPAGTELGNFTGEYGLDIVLHNGDYKANKSDTGFLFDLKYARATQCSINTTIIPSGYSEKQYREAIHHFIDPAAFYGLYSTEKNKVQVYTSGTKSSIKRDELYNNIISFFNTKNKVYIRIQGHLGRSYDYYGTYKEVVDNEDIIRMGVSQNQIPSYSYPHHKWPIIIQGQEQNHSEDQNSIYLQLVYSNGLEPLLYGQVATMADTAENNFLTATQLIPETVANSNGNAIPTGLTNPIKLTINAVDGATGKVNIANYIHLLYLGTELKATDTTGIEHKIKPIDTLFGPVGIEHLITSVNEEVIRSSVSHLYNLSFFEQDKSKIVTQTKIINDKSSYQEGDTSNIQDRVIYETSLIRGLGLGIFNATNPVNATQSASTIQYSQKDDNHYRIALPYFLETIMFSDNGKTTTGLKIEVSKNIQKNKYILGLTRKENDLLKNAIEISKGINTSVFLKEIDYQNFQVNEVSFSKYKVCILMENSDGVLQVIELSEALHIYSLDDQMYFSSEFSKITSSLFNPEEIIIPNFDL
ncbi:hypothetical protein ABW636_06940 [Aquimarina sp. 2201CG1-2-11]|uniref:hypothetical protein n=1 Tax=Aquimarina discodermiae TaxID=3231043 RepID=UPI0034634257